MAIGTALVVDDSSVNRLVLTKRLEGLNLEVLQAENGMQALELLGARPGVVDVVLLDVIMPELDGYETLAAMKGDEAIKHIPVLVVSSVEEQDSVVRCIELGATDYLTKPINPSILAARINASLAAKRLHDVEQESLERQTALNRTIQRQKEELSRFLSPQIAALISSPEGEQLLGGHRREITVVFCDLRGFTSFAEQADPEELFGLLGEYHGMLGRAITEHGGTLEHFAGDGVMVFFNDPLLQEDHVERAVRMAVSMRERFHGPFQRLAQARLPVGVRRGGRRWLRDPGPDRFRGAPGLRRHRQRDHPRLAPVQPGRGGPDPAQPACPDHAGGGRGVGVRWRAHAQGSDASRPGQQRHRLPLSGSTLALRAPSALRASPVSPVCPLWFTRSSRSGSPVPPAPVRPFLPLRFARSSRSGSPSEPYDRRLCA